jgi:glycosyltransferase involved in cell wall biosynthesis
MVNCDLPSRKAVLSVFGFEPFRIGAGEIFAHELSSQLAQYGWDSILCFLTPPAEPVRKFLDLPNVKIEVVPDSWKLSGSATRRLSELLRRYRPSVLHLHFTGFLSPYPWLARLTGVERVFFTDQSSRPAGHVDRKSPLWKRMILRVTNAPITRVISISRYGQRSFTATGLVPMDRSEMIYNSVDLSRADAGLAKAADFRSRYGIPGDRLMVAQASWMIPEKGIHDLIAAMKLVLAKKSDVQLVLAGDGKHRQEYIKLASDLGIADHVCFTGVVQDPLGEGLYAAADVVCQVSRWEEVFGYVIAEAMASSKPLLGTRVGGIPELIEDGKTGFLVERGDTEAMADRLLRLLEDARLREAMGQAGRRAAETRFNHKVNVGQLIKLYGIGEKGAQT